MILYLNRDEIIRRRAKIGDVYYMKVRNRYKIYQWAYRIPKRGDFIKVFDVLYKEVPDKENIEKLVKTEHSYIINFNAGGAYRTELAYLIDNYPVPEEYPWPKHMAHVWTYGNGINFYNIYRTDDWRDGGRFKVKSINELPVKFRNIKLLNSYPSASWIMYLFDVGFDIAKPELFYPGLVKNGEEIVEGYQKNH